MLKYECLSVKGKLNCFSLEIKEDTGILGQRDSGKEEIINVTFKLTKDFSGRILLDDIDITRYNEEIYWTKISVIFYDPMKLFNPIYDIASHFIELGISHGIENEEAILETAEEILKILGMKKEVIFSYPNQLKPLELKKIALALASFLEPEYIFIDDIEYNLSTLEIELLINSILDLKETFNMKLIVFDNDPAVISRLVDYVVVLYRGEIVEEGYNVIEYPYHPYTIDLIRGELKEKNLIGKGCIYSGNCRFSTFNCKNITPKLVDLGGRKLKCLGFPW
ncbi:ATP-binding cassette domain-containing protein [Sulfolobus sp. S-194]|uniref:ATP-binding cassette domain-containing protein n=1 Tax=Sulfolobus sp. S-194 TaxID=2512240 RepID=UPI001436DF96|nr:ATP-binding cassette domain-containing protein [Sulfolobus sp. S-194]QIW24613.1 ATP-binding cassette domain-containing protein [Sulfolobus sp. S-194]